MQLILLHTGGQKKNILLIVCSADRGLCGGFNGSIIKYTKKLSDELSKNSNLNYIKLKNSDLQISAILDIFSLILELKKFE